MTAQPLGDTNTIQRVGDWLVDVETGEIVSHLRADADWQPTSETDVEWILGLFLEEETAIYAREKQKQTILANLTAIQQSHERRLDWLRRRFAGALEQFARDQLDGQKKRSLRFAAGALRFRKTQPKRIVHDEKAAIAWAREHLPTAIAVSERLLVSDLPDVVPGVELVPASERFSIESSS